MKTIYKSEVLNQYFDTEEACVKAEKEHEEKKAHELALRNERADRAKEVKEAYENYLKLRAKFVEDYGSYHMTLTEKDLPALNSVNLFDLFNSFDPFRLF